MAWKPVRQLSEQIGGQDAGGSSTVSEAILTAVEHEIEGCARCDTSSDIAFGAMVRCFLDDRSVERLALARTPRCPRCRATLDEQSLVCWD